MIRFEGVRKQYGNSVVLDNLSFEIPEGQFVVLIGPSGCGKTTTLKMINRLIEPDQGKIFINGKNTAEVYRVALRRSIGYVIQQIGLFPNMTVAQNITVVPRLLKYDKPKCDEIVHQLLDLVNMPYEQYAHKYPSEMSGGQQQRIGVLRALAASPPIVLMDEPFGALDPMTRSVLQDEIKKLQKKLNKTIVFVTHDMEEALNLADTIIFMENGRIAQMASPEEMLLNPANDLIRSFMGKHIGGTEPVVMTAADFMRSTVYKVSKKRGILECTEAMARYGVDTLLAVNEDDTYAGTVSINNIRLYGRAGETIEKLVTKTNCTSYVGDDARECFDKLVSSGDPYVVVLNADETIAGIVTKTSMAKAMADALWGDVQ